VVVRDFISGSVAVLLSVGPWPPRRSRPRSPFQGDRRALGGNNPLVPLYSHRTNPPPVGLNDVEQV